MLFGNKLAPCNPVVDWRVVFFQQAFELTKFYSGELHETLIGKGADQQIGLARPAVPSAEREFTEECLKRFWIVQRCGSAHL